MLVIESMDADSEVRRVSPIVLHGGDTGFGTYTDLMNGPMDHGSIVRDVCLEVSKYMCFRLVHTLYLPETVVSVLQHRGTWHRLPTMVYRDQSWASTVPFTEYGWWRGWRGCSTIHLVQEPTKEGHL